MEDIVLFENGEIKISTKVEKESIWINQKELCLLFGRDKSVISRHINNIFKTGELEKEQLLQKLQQFKKKEKEKKLEKLNTITLI